MVNVQKLHLDVREELKYLFGMGKRFRYNEMGSKRVETILFRQIPLVLLILLISRYKLIALFYLQWTHKDILIL